MRAADNVSMARFIVALFFVAGSIALQAQASWEYLSESPERLIGILDLPDIVMDGCDPASTRATTRAFNGLSERAPVVGTIYLRDEGNAGCWLMIERQNGVREMMPALESGYEVAAAIVYERRGSWFRISIPRGSAWIRRDQKDFLPYPVMLRTRLAHTLPGWDGTLRETPGLSGKVRPLSTGWKELLDRQLAIDYLDSRLVNGEPWIYIRLVTETTCVAVPGVEPIAGWIPAYRASRSPSVWFASRGC